MGSREDDRRVGVLGATSLVGACLLRLLDGGGWQIVAFTRRAHVGSVAAVPAVEWRRLGAGGTETLTGLASESPIAWWVCLAPIWVLPNYFGMFKRVGAKRVVALSSTSVLTKESSADPAERALARRLANGESRLVEWGRTHGIEVTILRSTLIYGFGRDRNISTIARFIRRFGFFPLLSAARGLRQPVHAADIAGACMATLQHAHLPCGVYNLSGGETLAYRDMVARVFVALRRPIRLVRVPPWLFRITVATLRIFPRFRDWSPQMAERMNTDLIFSHSDAARDLAFSPRPFLLTPADLPDG